MSPLEEQQLLLTDEQIISGMLNGNELQLSTKVDIPKTIVMYQKKKTGLGLER